MQRNKVDFFMIELLYPFVKIANDFSSFRLLDHAKAPAYAGAFTADRSSLLFTFGKLQAYLFNAAYWTRYRHT